MIVMAVDDERKALMNLGAKLADIPEISRVELFQDPMKAVAFATEQVVDIAFLDIEMYGMTGLEMAKTLKDIYPKMNIVFVTGYVEYALDAFAVEASDYLLKPVSVEHIQTALTRLRYPITLPRPHFYVQTFGHFELLVDDVPVRFPRAKCKEVLAYLIDRRGASATKRELSSVLWPEEEYTRSKQAQLQTLISEMMKALRAVGAEEIIIKYHGNLAINIRAVDSDYYRFLRGNSATVNTYVGEYMANYSWAEFALGTLVNQAKKPAGE